jgi:hypothetical protein
MRKLILSTFTVASLSFCSAQSVGLRVGANLSNLSLSPESLASLNITQESLLGMALAIPVEFKVHKNVSIQTELGFLQKGFKSIQRINAGTSTIKSELKNYTNYASIPVMLKIHTASRLIQVYANVGPDAAWKIKSGQTGQTTTTVGDQITNTEVKNDINLEGKKRLSIGLQGGAGVKVKLGKAALVLDGRFLTELKDENGNINIAGLKEKYAKTQGWMTSLGIVFGL